MDDECFRIKMTELVSDDEYWKQFDWMNNATASGIIIEEFTKRIKKHPFIWKMFFMIR